MDQNKVLNDFYNSREEDSRLTKDRAHNIEFIITTKYIEKYLKPGMKILEVGAGTGRYSLYYANKGYEVKSLELIEHNIDVFKKHITDNMNIEVIQGNAIDLSLYNDNEFDIVLNLGPLYHLPKVTDMEQAINESIRVCKEGGILYFAMLSNESNFINEVMKNSSYLLSNEFDKESFDLVDIPFVFLRINEMKELFKNKNIQKLHLVGQDGLSQTFKNQINEFNDEKYNMWVKYLEKSCEDESIIGYSNHVLFIGKKI